MNKLAVGGLSTLGTLSFFGCREVCQPNELRHGDDCVMRPDRALVLGGIEDASVDGGDDGDTSSNSDREEVESTIPANVLSDAGDREACIGDACEPCNPDACDHGSSCIAGRDTLHCTCDAGYEGPSCELDLDECAMDDRCAFVDYPCVQTEAPGYVCQGQFAEWRMPGSLNVPAEYDAREDVVTDRVTGLMWQRRIPGRPGTATLAYAGCSGTQNERLGQKCTWEEAKQYCSGLVLAGHDDWRLPSKIELESILDDSRTLPAIDPTAFPETPISSFWSASTYRTSASQMAYNIIFTNGGVSHQSTTIPQYVRCVRSERIGSRTPQDRYVIEPAAGTVKDTRTRLTWAHEAAAASLTWDAAQLECESRRGAWRLPTRKELLTIVDTAHFNPAIDWDAFPDAPIGVCYWSSTLAAGDGDGPSRGYWTVLATDGSSEPLDPRGIPVPVLGIDTYLVRCVHD